MCSLSIITVCLNAGLAIEATVRSVSEQTFLDYEHIIIDGFSNDGSLEFLKNSNLNKVKLQSEPDTGIYNAMNKGIKLATGDLLIFLNAGDHFVSKDVLKIFLSKLKMDQADLFFGRIVWNDLLNRQIILSSHASHKYHWDLLHSNFPHPATLYKKELFSTVGLFNETYKILGDFEWNVRALIKMHVKFQVVDIIVSVFFADGVSNKLSEKPNVTQEIARIKTTYFLHNPIVKWVELKNDNGSMTMFLRKVVGKLYNKKLNRLY